MSRLEVLFTPADFMALRDSDLRRATCVVFDVLRATSTMVTALANGAQSIIPTSEISEALATKNQYPSVLLAGERDGRRISSELTGSISFDLGNSPREFTRDVVEGEIIVITTTNGTRALRACCHANTVLISSFLNMRMTADFLLNERAERLILICGGTGEQASFEDALGAGALCNLLQGSIAYEHFEDSAIMALKLFLHEQGDIPGAFAQSLNGKRLLSIPDLKEDVVFCSQSDLFPLVAKMDRNGEIKSSGLCPPSSC